MDDRGQALANLLIADLRRERPPRSWDEYARDLQTTRAALRHVWARNKAEILAVVEAAGLSADCLRRVRGQVSTGQSVKIDDKSTTPVTEEDGPTIDEYLDHAEEGQRLASMLDSSERCHDVTLEVTKGRPVAVSFSSDWHLGSLGCDYARFRADVRYLLDNAGWLSLVTVGDLIENCVSFKSVKSVLEQVLPPHQQKDMLDKLAAKLINAGSLKAACWGNHDVSRDERLIGSSEVAALMRRNKVPWFNGTGLLRCHVGSQVYTVYLTHTPRGKSMYNGLHGQGRLYREDYPAEIVVAAHLHRPAYSVDYTYPVAEALGAGVGGQRVLIACGTYLTGAGYALRAYGSSGRVGTPTVLLWPDRHRVVCLPSAEDAGEYRG